MHHMHHLSCKMPEGSCGAATCCVGPQCPRAGQACPAGCPRCTDSTWSHHPLQVVLCEQWRHQCRGGAGAALQQPGQPRDGARLLPQCGKCLWRCGGTGQLLAAAAQGWARQVGGALPGIGRGLAVTTSLCLLRRLLMQADWWLDGGFSAVQVSEPELCPRWHCGSTAQHACGQLRTAGCDRRAGACCPVLPLHTMGFPSRTPAAMTPSSGCTTASSISCLRCGSRWVARLAGDH